MDRLQDIRKRSQSIVLGKKQADVPHSGLTMEWDTRLSSQPGSPLNKRLYINPTRLLNASISRSISGTIFWIEVQ